MAGSLVAATGATVATLVQNITVNTPAGAQPGDRLAGFILRNNSSATWAENGTTDFTSIGTPTSAMACFERLVDGTEDASYTFNSSVNSNNIAVAIMMLFRGVGSVSGVSMTNQGASTSIALGSVAGVSGGYLAGCVVSPVNADSSYTVPASMTERVEQEFGANNCSTVIADEILATTGATGTRTFTRAASSNQKGLLIAFNPVGIQVSRWNGSIEVPVTITRWNGSAEVPVTVKRWNGSAETP